MPIFAEINLSKALGLALTAFVVPLALGWLRRSARSESLAAAGQRVIAYPQAMKVFVIVAWIAALGLAVFAGCFSKGGDMKDAAAILGFFVALILPLHVEAFGVLIAWDDTHLYTRSPWRKARTIPFSAVRSCDYSSRMQRYRIRTDGFGIIRLHQFARGIPELLAALPCPHPDDPPGRQQR